MSRTSSQQLRVAIEIRERILTGTFAAGARLAEIPIGEMLGVSRTPVRLALEQLAQEGLISRLPTGGFAVCAFEVNDIADAIEVRGALEGLAAAQAAERGLTSEATAAFQQLLVHGDQLLSRPDLDFDKLDAYADLNGRIHALIIETSGNRALKRALALNDKLPFAAANAFIAAQTTMPNANRVLVFAHTQHHQLFSAIARRECTRAQAIAQQHALNAIDNLRVAVVASREAMTDGEMPLIRLLARRKESDSQVDPSRELNHER